MITRRTVIAATLALAAATGSAAVATTAQAAPAPAAASAARTAAPAPVRIGSRGPAVKELQITLQYLDHYIAADGVFGPATAAAVKDVQRLNRYPVTGVVDARTWNALGFWSADYHTHTGPTLREGFRGRTVRLAQMLLADSGGGHVADDGVFGPATTRAVKQMQRANGFAVDGVVGPQSWQRLYGAAD